MTALTKQVDDGSVFVTLLEVTQPQASQFGSTQAASEKQRENGVIPFVLCGTAGGDSQKPPALVNGKPVAEPYPEALGSFDSPNACGQVWIEKSIVRRLIGKPSHCCQSEIDCGWGESSTFQFVPIAENDRPSESQPELGTVPTDEILDRRP